MSDYRTFVVPYDFSPHSAAALYTATDLARRLNAGIHLVHAIQTPIYAYGYGGASAPPPVIDMEKVQESALGSLREVAAKIRDFPGTVDLHVVEGAGLADTLCQLAEKLDADLIVMGTHGRTGLSHVFLGSVAERTLRRAPCPVLTVQAPEENEGR